MDPLPLNVTAAELDAAHRALREAFERLQAIQKAIEEASGLLKWQRAGSSEWLRYNSERNRLQMEWSEENRAFRKALAAVRELTEIQTRSSVWTRRGAPDDEESLPPAGAMK